MPTNAFNSFFDKIFVISLYDNTKRWKKVDNAFKRRHIKVERFVAIDGRCKTQGRQGCLDKLKSFEISYDVKIPITKGFTLQELIPSSSLTIGTILLLRQMVKKKWKRMLICEDDIHFVPDVVNIFKQGIKELGRKKWDILYLGCGNQCGTRGISEEKTGKTKYISSWNETGAIDAKLYVNLKDDLRTICDEKDCYPISKHLSRAYNTGGTWCYAYSLAGAKKVLKLLQNNAGNHIDQLLQRFSRRKKLMAIAFDPPIVLHEDLRKGRKSDIPW